MGSSRAPDARFQHRRILVVEDEAFMAEELKSILERHEATCLGPFFDVEDAVECATNSHLLDAAILDVNIGGKLTFEVADILVSRGIPIVFATGYDRSILPARFAHLPWCEKPVAVEALINVVAEAMLGGKNRPLSR